ncbi:serine hydrolase [Ramlibacter sp.]|uniref:serine hydrolase n=1 Tax=Ramlibacter sp. TaxID=1917967 RepID=UPI00345CC136
MGRESVEKSDDRPVDTDTVFEAASLTKPLASFIALQLAEEGKLDLAATLQSICGPYPSPDGGTGRSTQADPDGGREPR